LPNFFQERDAAANVSFLVLAILCLGFIVIRFYLLQSSTQVLVWFDSVTFADIARHPLFSREFWFGFSPPLYPYFMKYFWIRPEDMGPMVCCQSVIPGLSVEPIKQLADMPMPLAQWVVDTYSIASIMIAQWLISVTCWLLLGLSLYQRLQGPVVKLVGVAVIFGLGCEISIVIWERNLLTESLSISLLALISALLIKGLDKNSKGLFLLLLVSLFLFVNLRVTHLYFLMLTSLWIFFVLYRIKKFKWMIATAVFVIAIIIANQYILFKADRSISSIRSVVSSRIMSPGYEDIRSYFESNGMPSIPQPIIGKLWFAPYSDYPDLDHWINNDASPLYQKYLVTHPDYFFLKPFHRYNEANESLQDVFVPDLDWQTPANQKGLNLFFTNGVLWLLVLFPAILILRFLRKKPLSRDIHLPGLGMFFMVSGFLMALINWHGDLVELNRHVTPSMLQIRLGILFLILGMLDLFSADRGNGES
jgi:hypothetical protein